MQTLSRSLAIVALALAGSVGSAGPVAAQGVQAGVAGAVVSPVEVSGPPRAAPVEVATGMEMFIDDRIVTGANARLQVMLLDETVFTVGPGSDLVIDRFVYDPDQGTGEMAGQMTTGFLRYVSGQIGENAPEAVSIDTPAATIGIRGTALMIAEVPDQPDTFFCGVLGPGRDNNALARPGGCIVSNEAGVSEVLREGYGVFVTRGQAPGAPVKIPDTLLGQLQLAIRPAGTQGAGTGAVPAAAAEAAGLGSLALSRQDVAAQRGLSGEQLALLQGDFILLTESGATDELDQRPPSEILDELEIVGGMDPNVTVGVPFFAQLTWDTVPDLDLHLTGPNPGGAGRYHVFFADPSGPVGAGGQPAAVLGAAQSNIPLSEVLTVNALNPGGPTRISVFNFSDQAPGSTSLATQSNAIVSLLENGLIERGPGGTTIINGDLIDFVAAPNVGAGNTFVAYEIAPDGTVNTIGEFTDFANSVVVE